MTLQNREEYSKRETQSLAYEEVNLILLYIFTHRELQNPLGWRRSLGEDLLGSYVPGHKLVLL